MINYLRVEGRRILGFGLAAFIAGFGEELNDGTPMVEAAVNGAEVGLYGLVIMGLMPFLSTIATKWQARRGVLDRPARSERD